MLHKSTDTLINWFSGGKEERRGGEREEIREGKGREEKRKKERREGKGKEGKGNETK